MPPDLGPNNPYGEAQTPAQQQGAIKKASKTHADRMAEYVAAGGPYWYATALSSLPHPIDDITLEFGDNLYDRMLNDAQLASLVNVFKTGVLEDGVTFAPALAEDDPDHAAAAELAAWCTWVFEHLTTPLDEVLWDMGDAIAYGNRVAELVYETKPGPDGALQELLVKVSCKPRRMTAFVVDAYNNLVGLIGQIPGQTFFVQTGMIVDPETQPGWIDREKFAVLTFRGKDSDPRGTSICRAAYDAWYVKQQIKVQYLMYLAQFANPFLIGYTAEDADDEPTIDPLTGDIVSTDSPETIMARTLSTAANSRALAFPNSAKVDMHEVKGAGEAHLHGIDLQNREMAKAITSQTLATEDSKHQAKASSNTHQDVLDTIIRQTKRVVERMIARDMLTTLITINFGEKALQLMPKPTLGRAEQHDFPMLATAIAALYTSGFLHPSQLPSIDLMLGLSVRDVSDEPEQAVQDGGQGQPGQQEGNQGQPPPGQQAPVDPEQHAAAVITMVATRAHKARVKAREAAKARVINWDGKALAGWLERTG